MIKIYRKTTTVKAERFDGSWAMAKKYSLENSATASKLIETKFYVPTLNGRLQVHTGDWIATGVDGEHRPIADEIFKKTYAELPVIPSYVAKYMKACKASGKTLFDAIFSAEYFVEDYADYPGPTLRYISRHCEMFARAWLDGYQVEEDK